MSTGLSVFGASVQECNRWLKGIETELGDCQRQEAYSALRAVLHALRDRLQAQTAVKLAAQLPMLLRGLFYEGWTLPDKPTRTHTQEGFADSVRKGLPLHFRFDPITATRAVFSIIASFISPGEAAKVKAQLPFALRSLWPTGKMA